MRILIPTDPTEPAQRQRIALGGAGTSEQFELQLTWHERSRGWFLDVFTAAGVLIAGGRRLSPGSGPLLGISLADGPDGLFFVRGRADYEQASLGTEDLELWFYSTDDQPPAAADPLAPGVDIK